MDLPETEGELREDEFGSRIIERRRPSIRREDVELMGPTAGCPACHKQMLQEPLLGVSHTEECRRKHEIRMSRDGDPRFRRAFDNLMQEDEEVMRRKSANRQATEERELKGKRIADDIRGYIKERQPGSGSSGPYVPGDGAARQDLCL